MIVIETSALIAILQEEPEAESFLEIVRTERCVVSAITVYEAGIVLNARRGTEGVSNLLQFVEAGRFTILPFTAELIEVAITAYQRFGKGSGAPAGLNFGDCAAYALAKSLDAPLLFKGDDFASTDVRRIP